MKSVASLLLASVVISGCARTPPATISFPLTRTSAQATVTRSVKCDKTNRPHVSSDAKVDVFNAADPFKSGSLDLSRLDGALANTSLELHFTADQRLSSVNVESEGQGETIIKAAITLAGTLAKIAEKADQLDPSHAASDAAIVAACKKLTEKMGDQALSVGYIANLNFAVDSDYVPINPRVDDASNAQEFRSLLGSLCAGFELRPGATPPVATRPSSSGLAMLDARQPGQVELALMVNSTDATCSKDLSYSTSLWRGILPVGQRGIAYRIPIPRAAAFGKQKFSVAFDNSGALTELKYGKDAGVGEAIGAGQGVADAVKPPTDTDRVNAIDAAIALREARDRQAKCLADITQCS